MLNQIKRIVLRVPGSSANIGPGFDIIGIALPKYLELRITAQPLDTTAVAPNSFDCEITYEGHGADKVSKYVSENLITRTAVYVMKEHGFTKFPEKTSIHIVNNIPLGRGLGSSGAAVVAGVMFANEVGDLKLTVEQIRDYSLRIEGHPDNIAASLYGGLVVTVQKRPPHQRHVHADEDGIPSSEVLPEAPRVDTGFESPEEQYIMGISRRFTLSKELKAIVIIPSFEVSTAVARAALPKAYSESDATFNSSRASLLPTLLTELPLVPEDIYDCMQDRFHQPYRTSLIPGLTEILSSMTPKTHPGLCGICLSGAGPTILAFATKNFENIAKGILNGFSKNNIQCEWEVLEPTCTGAAVSRNSGSFESFIRTTGPKEKA